MRDQKLVHAVVRQKAFSTDRCDFLAEKLRGTGCKQHLPTSPPLLPTPYHNKAQQINAMHTEHEHTGRTEKILSILFDVKYCLYVFKIFFFKELVLGY